ncbi:hypothetical protein [Parabacteroides gordonii]|jgi:hypothetical protein|uniref:Uncharacterized protein n=1 Tax=Parabacteroides gordonii MS-1 = DSM 23371 TaxID=1203610 RepID=A0A0F5IVK6_9BACT|nr:hypothetical protein [Parabacteroides gordonii]KKB49581.1 hypothetical protein HMPREF1536_04646 [Parabacteroides gordonii MS-1 = DSM 23371]MCA5585840.1 hypothetical protein [Parabacteroides gordonii]RGP17052.1 hypothetical protein DXB27_10145 [Parabacteroides gordonii]
MIKIEKPQVRVDGTTATLSAYVTIDSVRKEVWFKVDKKYEEYLCDERGDAFVIAVLNFAMRNHYDIVSEAPLSEDLYYNIDKYLLDAIAQYNKDFYRPQITADVSSKSLPCAGAVGTGISCGVDSMHALASQTTMKFRKHNITHLTFNNVGSHGEGEKAENLYHVRLERPRRFAKEYGFEFVTSDSNLQDVIKQSHFKTHTYSSMFAVYCLQKLYSVYYYASSGYKYHEFRLYDMPGSSCGSYEMFSLPLLSTHNLRVYSEGEGMSRMTKLKSVVKYAPSYKYLNVCLEEGDNCGKCEKCVRTLLGIDALGVLEKYSKVFDIDYYREHKSWYLVQMLKRISDGKHDYFEMYPYFKNEITLCMRMQVIPYKIVSFFRRLIPRNSRLFNILKSIKEK